MLCSPSLANRVLVEDDLVLSSGPPLTGGVFAGSSVHRGARAAGWFDDNISEKGNTQMQSLVLVGGINAWADAGDRYVQQMDGFQEKPWRD